MDHLFLELQLSKSNFDGIIIIHYISLYLEQTEWKQKIPPPPPPRQTIVLLELYRYSALTLQKGF